MTKWTEVFLIQTKREAEDTIQLYVKSLVAPLGYRIVRLRTDRGTEYTGSAFREYCRQTAIQLEFAATNTSSQIGVNERIGRTLAGMTRSLLLDSGLPKYLWGELMLTAAYLSNRSLNSALGMEAPHKKLYGKEGDLSLLKIIGARAFVHIEIYTEKLGNKAWEGRLCGYSQESKDYRLYNPETRAR